MERVLVIGYGEIGKAIAAIEQKARNDVKVLDPSQRKYALMVKKVDRIHVCIPYSDRFVEQVQGFIDKYEFMLMVVHSTIPVGTMSKLSCKCFLVHSPVIGVHPNLMKGMIVFKKFIGGPESACMAASRMFKSIWIDTDYLGSYETTELAKLLSTSYYGWNIAFATEAKRLCDEHDLDFDRVYTRWNQEYNRGYTELEMPQVVRPVLKPSEGGLGGHCVYENAQLLGDSVIAKVITALGKARKE